MTKPKNVILYIDSDINMLNKFIMQTGYGSMNISAIVCNNKNIGINDICNTHNIRLFEDDHTLHHFAKLSKSSIVLLDHYIKPSENIIDNSNKYKVISCVPSNRISDAGDKDIYKVQLDRFNEYNYTYGGMIVYNYITNSSYYNMNVPIFRKDTPEDLKRKIDGYHYKHYPSIVEQVIANKR